MYLTLPHLAEHVGLSCKHASTPLRSPLDRLQAVTRCVDAAEQAIAFRANSAGVCELKASLFTKANRFTYTAHKVPHTVT